MIPCTSKGNLRRILTTALVLLTRFSLIFSQSFDSTYRFSGTAGILELIPMEEKKHAALGFEDFSDQDFKASIFVAIIDSTGAIVSKKSCGPGYPFKCSDFVRAGDGYIFYMTNFYQNPAYLYSWIIFLSDDLTLLKKEPILVSPPGSNAFIHNIKVFNDQDTIHLFASTVDDSEEGINRVLFRKYGLTGAKYFESKIDSVLMCDVVKDGSNFYLLASFNQGMKILRQGDLGSCTEVVLLSDKPHRYYGTLAKDGDELITSRMQGVLPSEVYVDRVTLNGTVRTSFLAFEEDNLILRQPPYLVNGSILNSSWGKYPPTLDSGKFSIWISDLITGETEALTYEDHYVTFDGDSIIRVNRILGAQNLEYSISKESIEGIRSIKGQFSTLDTKTVFGLKFIDNGYVMFGSNNEKAWVKVYINDSNVGIKELENLEGDILIWPNPGSGNYIIKSAGSPYNGEVKVYDYSGRFKDAFLLQNGVLSMDGYPTGVYYLRLTSEENFYFKILHFAN